MFELVYFLLEDSNQWFVFLVHVAIEALDVFGRHEFWSIVDGSELLGDPLFTAQNFYWRCLSLEQFGWYLIFHFLENQLYSSVNLKVDTFEMKLRKWLYITLWDKLSLFVKIYKFCMFIYTKRTLALWNIFSSKFDLYYIFYLYCLSQ